jgi:hypothetical protein
VVLGARGLFAQGLTTGSIEGTVADAGGGPLPGVTLEALSPALQGTRVTVSSLDGKYRFSLLPPGTYRVSASLDGFEQSGASETRVYIGTTASLPVRMRIVARSEVAVTAEAPLVDTTHTHTGVSLPADTLTKLPLGRNYSSAMLTVGGVGQDSQGNTVYGATGLENSYVVEGLNTTGVLQGAQGKQLNLEFVQEVEVRTGAYEAEYGGTLGASLNVLTKSGGNEFHGGAFGYYDSAKLASSDKHVDERNALNLNVDSRPERYDVGLDLGGYLLKDRLWFFGAYDRVAENQDYRRVDSLTYTSNAVISNLVPGTDVTRSNIYSAKLTLKAGPSHTFVASVFGDPKTKDGRWTDNPGPASAVIAGHVQGGTDAVARWEGIFGTQLLGQAQYGYHSEDESWTSDYPDSLTVGDVRRGEFQFAPGSGPGYIGPTTLRRNAWSGSLTAFLGSHDLKVGVGYEYLNSSYSEFWPAGGQITRWYDDGGAFQYAGHNSLAKVPLNCLVRTDGSTGNFGFVDPTTCNAWDYTGRSHVSLRTHNLSLFLQDSWKPLSNLTVNAGVRYEDQRLYDAEGQPRVKLTNQLSPRVGVVWDPLAKGRSKVFVSYGRFYQVIPQALQIFAMGNEYNIFALNTTEDHLDLVNDSNLNPSGEYIVGSDYVPPGIKGTYQDEIVAGVEAQIGRNWSVGLRGIYRSLGRVLENRCDVYDPRSGLAGSVPPEAQTACMLMNPGEGPNGQLSDPANPACWQDYPASTIPKPCESVRASRVFRALQLDVRRRFSAKFQLQASYVLSRLTGNYDGFVSEWTGQSLPGGNSDFDIPEKLINVWGRMSLDRTHQVRVSGFYVLPFGLQAGINAWYASGGPLSILGWAPNGYSRYLAPRGSYDQLPSTYSIDLHLEYAFRIGPVSLTPLLDVFNLTNVQRATKRGEEYNNVQGAPEEPPYTSPTIPTFGKDIAWQSPRSVRLGARASF